MARYAERTHVPALASRLEIERLCMKYGAGQFISGISDERAVIGFTMAGRQVKFYLPMPKQPERESARRTYEQLVRSRWRALALVIKAKLEAVASNITTFEVEFMPYTVMPDGKTVAEHVLPKIAETYKTGKMPPLLGYEGGP
jgi:vacuolar-type H+-ATPase subunit F/Vma7